MNKGLVMLCTVVELGCIWGLAAIGLKRNNDAYKAELRAIEAESQVLLHEIHDVVQEAEIKALKKELEELKKGEKEEA